MGSSEEHPAYNREREGTAGNKMDVAAAAAAVGGRDVQGNLKKKKKEKQVSIFITYDLPLLQIPNYSSIKK